MPQELKIRITNYQQIEKQLKKLGTTFLKETLFIDTYFNFPHDNVLKIVETTDGSYLIRFEARNGKFDLVSKEKIDDLEYTKEKLIAKYGIKKILRGKRREFTYQNFAITLNLIEHIGEFLILTGANPTKKVIEQTFGIKNPQYITVPFDQIT